MLATSTIFSADAIDDGISAPCPRRADLARLREPAGLSPVDIQVHRNYAFELVGSVLPPFLWKAGLKPKIGYGTYDDSLTFAQVDAAAIQIISLDLQRYGEQAYTADFVQWLAGRLEHLRSQTEAPIIVSDWPSEERHAEQFNFELEQIVDRLPSVFVWQTCNTLREMRGNFFDDRAASAKGSRLSDAACIELARSLGLIRLPSVIRPRIKAVVVDLDNTLYDGVLGEDGIEGVTITAQHTAIYEELLRLRKEGVFLGILSKNDPRDFARLCSDRPDFLLGPEHFSADSIGWHSKPEGLNRIAGHLHIATDSILVVDDNPAEIEQLGAVHPSTHLLYAHDSAETLFWLRHYPGLNGYRTNSATKLRVKDLGASVLRNQLRANSPADYLREMRIELTYALNPANHRGRLAELSQKTNQFNTGLQRFSEVQVASRLATPGYCTISMGMRDRFCDSGVIGAIFAQIDGNDLLVDEVCISCRALGRNVESAMIARAVAPIAEQYSLRNVAFKFHEGPRNLPARMWLTGFTGVQDVAEGTISIAWASIPRLNEYLTAPIASKWESTAQ